MWWSGRRGVFVGVGESTAYDTDRIKTILRDYRGANLKRAVLGTAFNLGASASSIISCTIKSSTYGSRRAPPLFESSIHR